MDEIHRFNKIQQDAFLPHIENGTIVLIGATTENPSFSLNNALLSRCRVLPLKKLTPPDLEVIMKRSLDKRGFILGVHIDKEAITYLSNVCDGDARTALNSLQIAMDIHCSGDHGRDTLKVEDIKECLQRSHVLYDRRGDEHYHCASALQKSIRGSDENAALYWVMRMLVGGEDPMFIARRLVVVASEDVGLADPQALSVAVSAMHGCQLVGIPECQVILAEAVVYLSRASKSREVYHAMRSVLDNIKNTPGNMPGVPLHLRNANSSH
ncbi:ycaJ [Lepeophtheirus salmonis]|uniref:YcaJ n=1 Tax=Lepeophtheirus salmonis TaxID=72036 RepID=A0A7R8H9W6_LEPSM|nr:ycaJ [Lepeophtheirus salmonis]CAF2961143.1 ycaJ [Lepeophtheirus salmonis]